MGLISSPKYVVTQAGIVNMVASDNMQPGDILPTEKKLAERFGVSVITVRHAMKKLEDSNVVRREQGRGTFLVANISDRMNNGIIAFLDVSDNEIWPYLKINHVPSRLSNCLSQRGYKLTMLTTDKRCSGDVVERLRDVSGVIATGFITEECLQVLESLNLPVVVIGDVMSDLHQIPMVTYNWRRLTTMMANTLFESGVQKVGMLMGGRTYAPSIQMREGLRYALARRGEELDQSRIFYSDFGIDLFAEMGAFLDAHSDLDGLLVESACYVHVLSYLVNKPWRPKIAIISSRATYWQMNEDIYEGAFADDIYQKGVELLFEVMQSPKKKIKGIKLKPHIVKRKEMV